MLFQQTMSSIVLEGKKTVFFLYKTYFNNKPHKQNHLTNIKPNIYKKRHPNCSDKLLARLFIKHLKYLEQMLFVTSKQ